MEERGQDLKSVSSFQTRDKEELDGAHRHG
jgi:hypothetical protein